MSDLLIILFFCFFPIILIVAVVLNLWEVIIPIIAGITAAGLVLILPFDKIKKKIKSNKEEKRIDEKCDKETMRVIIIWMCLLLFFSLIFPILCLIFC